MIDYRGYETDCVFFDHAHAQGADECWCDRGKGTYDPKCDGCRYYLNRKEALKKLEDVQEAEEPVNGFMKPPRYYAMDAVNNVPAADVVEVVRCKDCKHKPHTKEPDGDGYGFDITADDDFTCPFLCDDGYYNRMPSNDFYCGYGERKEQEHE